MLHKIGTFAALNRPAKLAHFQALFLPFLIWTGFRLSSVSRTQKILRQWASPGKPAFPSGPAPQAAIANCRRAQRNIRHATGAGGTCLVRSLTLWAMLLRRGISTDLRVGMRKTDGKIEGHAWLEYQGEPLNEDSAVIATYSVLAGPASFDLWKRA